MQLNTLRVFTALALLVGLVGVAAAAPAVSAQEPCDLKLRIGDGAWSDDITLPINVPLTIAGSNYAGSAGITILFEPPGGLGHTIPEWEYTDWTGAFEESFSVQPGYFVAGVWTVSAFLFDQDPTTADCIDYGQITVVTTPGGPCGLAAGIDPAAEGSADLAVSIGQEFRVWGSFLPIVFVDVTFLRGGELIRTEQVLSDNGQGYIEVPITFMPGEEGEWTVSAGWPGSQCVAAVAVTVTAASGGETLAIPASSQASAPAALGVLPNTAVPVPPSGARPPPSGSRGQ